MKTCYEYVHRFSDRVHRQFQLPLLAVLAGGLPKGKLSNELLNFRLHDDQVTSQKGPGEVGVILQGHLRSPHFLSHFYWSHYPAPKEIRGSMF